MLTGSGNDAAAVAFGTLTFVARVLREAVGNGQEFTADLRAGVEVYGEQDGCPLRRPDGSCEIRISVGKRPARPEPGPAADEVKPCFSR